MAIQESRIMSRIKLLRLISATDLRQGLLSGLVLLSAACGSKEATPNPADALADSSAVTASSVATNTAAAYAASTGQSIDCAGKSQSVSMTSCLIDDDASTPADLGTGAVDAAATAEDATAASAGGAGAEYGPTQSGSQGNDDDCKYHVTWESTPVAQGQDLTFKVTLTTLSDGKPNGSAPIFAEVFLDDKHGAPDTKQSSRETTTPGTYLVGPVRVDQAGQWTVRFHVHGECSDLADDSPHGHAAFFFKVP